VFTGEDLVPVRHLGPAAEEAAGEGRAMRGRRLARAALQWRTRGEEAGERRWRAGTREEREAAREREARAGGGR
jgi:hypothetical protein